MTIDMCSGSLPGKILRFSIPLVLSGILQLLFNAADRPLTLPLPPGDWTVLADGESSFRWQSDAPVSEAAAAPHTALLLGRRD